jgi:hypothetical protein
MRPMSSFYYRLVLKPEMDSNLIWIGPPNWLGCPCLTPKVVAKEEEDVLGYLLGVLHLLGACFNVGLGPKCEYQACDDAVAPDRNNSRMSR